MNTNLNYFNSAFSDIDTDSTDIDWELNNYDFTKNEFF